MPNGMTWDGDEAAAHVKGFNDYFAAGPELGARLQAAVDGIDGDGNERNNYQSDFWSDPANSDFADKSRAHFEDHWLGRAGSGYWPGADGDDTYRKLAAKVREGAVAAQKGPRPLRIELQRGRALDAQVAEGDDAVTITIDVPEPG